MKSGGARLLETGAIGSAVAASICCIGPLALALLGLGGGALLLKVAPFRPYFLGATALLLAGAFYSTYRRPLAEACAPGSPCALPSGRTRQKAVLWVVTGVVILAATFPVWSKVIF